MKKKKITSLISRHSMIKATDNTGLSNITRNYNGYPTKPRTTDTTSCSKLLQIPNSNYRKKKEN